jgi:hypothetical protein
MTENRAEKAKNHMKATYAFGIAAFVGGLSAIAMVVWLVHHMK